MVEYEDIETITEDAEGASLGFGETRRNSQAKGPCPDKLWKAPQGHRRCKSRQG